MKSIELQTLLDQGQVWAGQLSSTDQGRATGYAELDAALAQSGWPKHGIVDLHSPGLGHGELQLVLPSLAQNESRLWLWLDPPMQPCSQALIKAGLDLARCLILRTQSQGDALWALERCLQSGCVDSALSWLREAPSTQALRRLQIAAERGGALAHLLHDQSWQIQSGTHARIGLLPGTRPGQVQIHIQHQRGGPQRQPLELGLLAVQAAEPRSPKPAQFAPLSPDAIATRPLQNRLQLAL